MQDKTAFNQFKVLDAKISPSVSAYIDQVKAMDAMVNASLAVPGHILFGSPNPCGSLRRWMKR